VATRPGPGKMSPWKGMRVNGPNINNNNNNNNDNNNDNNNSHD
jgi:hypothetical protein